MMNVTGMKFAIASVNECVEFHLLLPYVQIVLNEIKRGSANDSLMLSKLSFISPKKQV